MDVTTYIYSLANIMSAQLTWQKKSLIDKDETIYSMCIGIYYVAEHERILIVTKVIQEKNHKQCEIDWRESYCTCC